MSAVQDLDFLPGFALEGFPNRDSTIYKDLYGLNNVHTILRGTLRFKGFSNTIRTLQYLRLTDSNPHPSLHPNGPDITWVCIYICMQSVTIIIEKVTLRDYNKYKIYYICKNFDYLSIKGFLLTI